MKNSGRNLEYIRKQPFFSGMKFSLFLLFILVPFCFSACTKDMDKLEEPETIYILNNIEIWYDLMPGGEALLYFSATLSSNRADTAGLSDIKAEAVRLYTGDSLLAVFPQVVIRYLNPVTSDSLQNIHQVQLVPQKGVPYNSNVFSGIRLEAVITSGNASLVIKKTDLDIAKVY